MGTTKIVQAEFRNEVERYIKCGLHGIVYGMVDTPYVQVHRKTQVNENTCGEFGYGIIEMFHNGGTLVLNPGDVLIGHFAETDNKWHERFAKHFAGWLKNKGLNAEYEGNDVLVDDYKVCGYCVTRYGRIDFTGVFIGINTKLDHIKAICHKPMVKVPRGLSDYGITTAQVERMFLDFCKQDKE